MGGDAGSDETEPERLRRNWNDLLQEMRVTQTGIQILFGFLLTLPFAAGFDRLDGVGGTQITLGSDDRPSRITELFADEATDEPDDDDDFDVPSFLK